MSECPFIGALVSRIGFRSYSVVQLYRIARAYYCRFKVRGLQGFQDGSGFVWFLFTIVGFGKACLGHCFRFGIYA